MSKVVFKLVEAPRKRAICETQMRYDILCGEELVGEAYFNMTGYNANVKYGGRSIGFGEYSISRIKKDLAWFGRELSAAKEAK